MLDSEGQSVGNESKMPALYRMTNFSQTGFKYNQPPDIKSPQLKAESRNPNSNDRSKNSSKNLDTIRSPFQSKQASVADQAELVHELSRVIMHKLES